MEQYLHDDMHTVIDYSLKSGKSFFQSEKELLGYTHADVTELLISRWNLPDMLYYPLVFHHSPEQLLSMSAEQNSSSPETITSICHIADHLCYSDEMSDNKPDFAQPRLEPVSLKIVGFTERELELLKSQIPEMLESSENYAILFT